MKAKVTGQSSSAEAEQKMRRLQNDLASLKADAMGTLISQGKHLDKNYKHYLASKTEVRRMQSPAVGVHLLGLLRHLTGGRV